MHVGSALMIEEPYSSVNLAERDQLGRFTPGNGGRPLGARNKTSRAAIMAVTALFDDALNVLRTRLSAGDLAAAKIVLESVLPKNGRAIDFGCDVSPNSIEAALASGAITPAEAQTAANALEKLAGVRDLADLAKRVEELEAALAKGQK